MQIFDLCVYVSMYGLTHGFFLLLLTESKPCREQFIPESLSPCTQKEKYVESVAMIMEPFLWNSNVGSVTHVTVTTLSAYKLILPTI